MRSQRRHILAWWTLAAVLLAAAALLPVERVVNSLLPAELRRYQAALVEGLQLTRLAVAVDGLLCLAAPWLSRLFADERPNSLTPPPPLDGPERLLVVLLTVFAAALRLYHLGMGFTYDEWVISSSMMERSLPHLFARAEPWRALYAMLGRAAYLVCGRSEWAARLPGFLAGVASIPVMYLLARRWINARVAVVSAFLLATSTFHVWYSQIATAYSLVLFLVMLSMLLFERCRVEARGSRWVAWGVVSWLALYSHFFIAAFVLLAQGLHLGWLVATRRTSSRVLLRWAVIMAGCTALFFTLTALNLPLSSAILSGLATSNDASWIGREPRGTLVGQVILFSEWLTHPFAPRPLQVVALAVAGAGLWLTAKRNRLLAVYVCLPTVILWGLFACELIRRITQRHSIFTLIPFCLLSAVAVVEGWEWLLRRTKLSLAGAVVAAVAACLAAAPVFSMAGYYGRERSVFRPTADYLKRHVGAGESVMFTGWGHEPFQYYTRSLQPLPTYADLHQALLSERSFWCVCFLRKFLDEMPPDTRSLLQQRAVLVFEYEGWSEYYADPAESFVWYVHGSAKP